MNSYHGTFNSQNLQKKLSRSVGILSKLRHSLSYKTLISVYYALFDAHVNYCLQYLSFVTAEIMNKLSSLQNKALRIIHFKSQRDQTRPLYIQSKILTITISNAKTEKLPLCL